MAAIVPKFRPLAIEGGGASDLALSSRHRPNVIAKPNRQAGPAAFGIPPDVLTRYEWAIGAVSKITRIRCLIDSEHPAGVLQLCHPPA